MVNGYVATSLEEALKIRSEKEVVPYGGGTDLMIEASEDQTYLFLHSSNMSSVLLFLLNPCTFLFMQS